MSSFQKDNEDNFDISRSEIFNSDYYFDDIIEELNESGLYSEEDLAVPPNEKKSPDTEGISEKMSGIQQDLTHRIQKLEQKVFNTSEMLFNTKSELVQIIQKMQNNLLLMKFETEEGINKIGDLIKDKLSQDSVKEKAFEELYSQLEAYKRDFMYSAVKPFIHDLLLLYDRIDSEIAHHGNKVDDTCSKLISFRDELLEILYRNDITPLERSRECEKFDPEKSNVVDKCKTERSELDNLVKSVLKVGFKRGDNLIRPEMIQIYKYSTNQDS
ncbi:MAG: nucleotide exchange factor GrpE [Candidatus Delongbacteria bacterium]